jgi:hypothetical protein
MVGDIDDVTTMELAAASHTFLAVRGLSGALLALGPNGAPPAPAAAATAAAAQPAALPAHGEPMLVAFEPGTTAAIKLYLRSELAALLDRANAAYRQAVRGMASAAATASPPAAIAEGTAGTGACAAAALAAASAAAPPRVCGVREMVMSMERVTVRDCGDGGKGGAACGVGGGSGAAAAAAALLKALSYGDDYCVPQIALLCAPHGQSPVVQQVMRHRVVMGLSQASAGDGAAAAARSVAATEQALEFAAAALALVSAWRPLAAAPAAHAAC